MKVNFFIYRPDRMQSSKINPDLCYTLSDQPFSEWQRDERTAYDYKVAKLLERVERIPDHQVFDFWR